MFYTLRRQISYNIPSEVSFPLNSSFRCPRKKILIMSVYFIFASSLPLPAGTVLGSTDVLMLLVCGGNSLLSQLPRSPLRPPPSPRLWVSCPRNPCSLGHGWVVLEKTQPSSLLPFLSFISEELCSSMNV